jgi:uncharacterized protein involved in exopolysaccharide biosynthesis
MKPRSNLFGTPAFLRLLGSADAKLVATCAVIGGLLATGLTFVWPAKYDATTSLLLDSSKGLSGILESGGLSDLLPSGSLGGSNEENGFAYVQLCRSNSILGQVLSAPSGGRTIFESFAPAMGTPREREEEALDRIRKSLSTSFDARANVLRITVRTRDPALSAEIANRLVGALRRFNSEVRSTRSRDALSFAQARLGESHASLVRAEQNLSSFQASNARIGNAPVLLTQLKRLERELRLNEETYALLSRQVELSRIQDKRDSPVFSIVDSAVQPAKPTRISPLIAGVLGAMFCGFAAFLARIAFPPRGGRSGLPGALMAHARQ